jgi:hypothetical protein
MAAEADFPLPCTFLNLNKWLRQLFLDKGTSSYYYPLVKGTDYPAKTASVAL